MNNSALRNALVIGTVLQLAMILIGHYNEFVQMNVFAIGGMAISFVAGALYGRSGAAPGRGSAATGGMIVGGLCALVGIIVSIGLGDTETMILAIGTISSAVTGAIGGAALFKKGA